MTENILCKAIINILAGGNSELTLWNWGDFRVIIFLMSQLKLFCGLKMDIIYCSLRQQHNILDKKKSLGSPLKKG